MIASLIKNILGNFAKNHISNKLAKHIFELLLQLSNLTKCKENCSKCYFNRVLLSG